MRNWLTNSSAIASRSPASPMSSSRFGPMVPASLAPASDATIAAIACGRNSPPYAVLDRSYQSGLVRIELAAGNVTSATPCARPAA